MGKKLVVRARKIIANAEQDPIINGALLIEDGMVKKVERDLAGLDAQSHEFELVDFGEGVVLPGLIDCHCHLCLAGDGTYAGDLMDRYDDHALTLLAAQNAQKALAAGVTTLRDLGSRGQVVFSLRKAIEDGRVVGPRLVVAGVPLTITGGHLHYFGGEVDSVDEIVQRARRTLKQGADLIKIIANGGGTKHTIPWHPSFTTEEIRAAVAEAHRFGRHATAHVSCAEAIRQCLDANIDGIEHCDFWRNRENYVFEPELADRVAEQGVYVGKTLPAVYRTIQRKAERVREMTRAELEFYDFQRRILENSMRTFQELHSRGVRLVASTDAGWEVNPFGDYVTDLELMVECGMSPREALVAATIQAARALQLDDTIGSLEPGKAADFVVVSRDPLDDIRALREPLTVYLNGQDVTQALERDRLR